MSSSVRYDRIMQRRFITSDDIRAAASRGERALALPENSTITEEARELALKLSIRIGEGGSGGPGSTARAAQAVGRENPRLISELLDGARPQPMTPGSGSAQGTDSLSGDAGARISEAIVAVVREMNLGPRAAAILPIVTRRVYAGLAGKK